MKAIVVYESLTGNTETAGHLIAGELISAGVEAVACPITQVDLQSLSEAELVVVGSWTDGLFFFGQRPGRVGRLAKLPVIDGKKAAVYCTYAHNPGKTLDKLSSVIRRRGGDVIGGYAIQRKQMAEGAAEFVDRLLGALDLAETADA
jgi:flavorubredoxin